MECDLKWNNITCWEDVPRLTVTREETLETAIPDYVPDMGRIVEAAGQICLRSVTAQNGTVELRGSVRVNVLYTSEEGPGLRSLTQDIPFACTEEAYAMDACKVFWATGHLLLCEARALTPRRLSLRVMAEWEVAAFRPVSLRLCAGVEDGDPTVYLRTMEREVCLTAALAEREYSVSGEAAAPADGSAPEEVLLHRVYPRLTSCQSVGNKLLVKGELLLSVLYRCQQQKLHTYTVSVPFSQIVESPVPGEEGEITALPQLAAGEVRLLRREETAAFTVTAELHLLLRVTRQERISCVTDLYSTRGETRLETAEVVLPHGHTAEPVRQEAVQHLDFGRRQPFVCVTEVDCTPAVGEDGMPSTAVRLRLLYLDEENTPAVTERTVTVPLEEGETAALSGAPVVALAGGGCDLRQAVEITPPAAPQQTLTTVTAAELKEDTTAGRRPSLVMRRLTAGETLWDVAKQYRTDQEMIRAVNQLAEGELPGKMLLIPRVR